MDSKFFASVNSYNTNKLEIPQGNELLFLKSKKYNYRLFMFSTFKPYYGILVDSYKFSNLKYKKLKCITTTNVKQMKKLKF